MKLTAKLVSVFVLGIMVLIAFNGYFAIKREVTRFEQDASADAALLGSAIEEMFAVTWREDGQQRAIEWIRSTSTEQHAMKMRWVWFDAAVDDPHGPRTPAKMRGATEITRMVSFTVHEPNVGSFIHAYWPIAVDEQPAGGRESRAGRKPRKGGLELSKPTTELEDAKREVVVRTLTLMGSMTVLVALLATAVGVAFVGRPLEKLTDKTRRVAEGDLSGPVELRSHDELGELGASLNSMCDQLVESQKRIQDETASRVAAMAQLRHADRLRTVGRLAAGVAHELGTPLSVISGRAGLIASDKLNDQQRTDSALTIKAEADRMAATIRQLLDFARRNRPRKASVDLHQVAEQTIELLSPLAEDRKLRLVLSPNEGKFDAMVDVGQVQQVLTNLIVNAMHASSDNGTIQVAIERREVTPPEEHGGAAGEYDCVRVEDQGMGIKQEDIDQLFEPFFTTKDVGEGTGLGLSIAYGIVQEHGGWIDVESELGKGSCFSVYVPREIAS